MAQIALNAVGNTYVDAYNGHSVNNYSQSSILYGGYAEATPDPTTGTNADRFGRQSLFYFQIPDFLKSSNFKITGLRFAAQKYGCQMVYWDASGYRKVEQDWFDGSYCGDQVAYMTAGDVTYSNMASHGFSLKTPKSFSIRAATGDYYSFDIDLSLSSSGISDYFTNNFYVVRIMGSNSYIGNTLAYNTNQTNAYTASLVIDYEDQRPTAKITSYPSLCSVAQSATIAWSYTSPISSNQNGVTLQYSTNSGSSWTTIQGISATASSYTIPANTFGAGRVYFRLMLTDAEGHSSVWTDNIVITYQENKPQVKISSYPTTCATTHSATITWKYNSPDGSSQNGVTLQYSTDAGANWTTVSGIYPKETSYTVPADTMQPGNVYFRVRVKDADNRQSDWSNQVVIAYHVPAPVIAFTDWAVTNLNRVSTLPVTWSFHSDDGYKQAQVVIKIKSPGVSDRTVTVTGEDQYYTFPIKYFTVGSNTISLTATDSHGLVSSTISKSFTVYNQVPVVVCGYPSNVTINNGNVIIFTWSFTEEINRGQKAYELMYSSDNEATWTTVTETTGNLFKEFPGATFLTGTIIWKIRAKDIDDNWSQWAKTSFEAIGVTAAPVITEVTNSSIPTVKWTVSNQDCYEVNLRDSNNKLIYQSQLQIGSTVRQFKCPVMLENGFYSVEVRVLNTYGAYTAWSSYSFQIDLDAPDAPEDVFVYLDTDLSIAIDGEGASGVTTYVVRRDEATQEVKILGKFIGNTVRDYTAALGKSYSYTLRSYGGEDNAGYTDGDWTVINIPLENHVLLHRNDDRTVFVDLFKGENSINVQRADTYSKTFHFTIGREFPVIERTAWNTSTRKFEAWISDKDLEVLINMNNTDIYYRSDNEAFLVDMTCAIGEKYVDGGRFVTVSLTRLEENEVSLL